MNLHRTVFLAAIAVAPTFAQAEGVPAPTPPIPILREAVDGVVNEQRAVILKPDQIDGIRRDTSAARKEGSFHYPNRFVAKPVNRAFYIEPDATRQPRLIRLSMGAITSLVFSDANGNPWLVKSADFDGNLFEDPRRKDAAGKGGMDATNIVKIAPKDPYANGNIVIELEGLTSPIVFVLGTGQSDETDMVISARVAGRNPNAKPQLIALDRMPDHDSVMGYFLDGVPPEGARRLNVSGGNAEIWSLGKAMYVRTRMTLLSPAFTNHVGSADGMHVYKFFSVTPSILASANGKTTTLVVSGY